MQAASHSGFDGFSGETDFLRLVLPLKVRFERYRAALVYSRAASWASSPEIAPASRASAWEISPILNASAEPMIGPNSAGNACANGQDAKNKAAITLRIAFRIVLRSAGRLGIR